MQPKSNENKSDYEDVVMKINEDDDENDIVDNIKYKKKPNVNNDKDIQQSRRDPCGVSADHRMIIFV